MTARHFSARYSIRTLNVLNLFLYLFFRFVLAVLGKVFVYVILYPFVTSSFRTQSVSLFRSCDLFIILTLFISCAVVLVLPLCLSLSPLSPLCLSLFLSLLPTIAESWSGKGLVRNYADPLRYSLMPLPAYWNRTLANNPAPLWDFRQFIPDAGKLLLLLPLFSVFLALCSSCSSLLYISLTRVLLCCQQRRFFNVVF